jgi:hypothetical protein
MKNQETSNKTWIIGCLSAAAVIIAAIIGLGVPFAERLADVYFPSPTPALNPIPPTQVVIATIPPQPVIQSTSVNIPPATFAPFCAFLTRPQVEELKNIQGVSEAIKKAEEFSGFQQNNYNQGYTIPVDVLIATDLRTTNIEQFRVIPINRQGGWGLFLTTIEFQAPNAGTYWCIHEQ